MRAALTRSFSGADRPFRQAWKSDDSCVHVVQSNSAVHLYKFEPLMWGARPVYKDPSLCLSDEDLRYWKEHRLDEAIRQITRDKPSNPLEVLQMYLQDHERPCGSPKAVLQTGFRDNFVVSKLNSRGVRIVKDPISVHTTRNVFIQDKMVKQKMCLVTVCQDALVDINVLGQLLGYTEPVPCQDYEGKLGSKKGSVSVLSLLYDGGSVRWCVDERLLALPEWRIGISPKTNGVGYVADVPLQFLKELLQETGHWTSMQVISVD